MKPTKKTIQVEIFKPDGNSTLYKIGTLTDVKSIKCLGGTVIVTRVHGLEQKYVGLPYVAEYSL